VYESCVSLDAFLLKKETLHIGATGENSQFSGISAIQVQFNPGMNRVKRSRKWRYQAEYTAFRMASCALDALPLRWSIRCAEMLAWLLAYVLPEKVSRRKVARENLQTAFGDELTDRQIDQMIYDMWVHLFRMVIEVVLHPRKMRLYNLRETLQYRDRNYSTRSLCCGRPVMFMSGHYGNWEIGNTTFGLYNFPMGFVARDLDNPYLHKWFSQFRVHTGHRMISKKGGGTDMASLLEQGGNIGLLCDQDAGKKGLFVPFFGKQASTFKSIALLAIEMDAIIVVGYTRRLKDDFINRRWVGFELGCQAVIDPRRFQDANAIKQITAEYTRALENAVRLSPEQYFWVHRRWKSEPRQRKSKALKAA